MTFSQGNQAAFKKRTLLPRSKVSRDRRRNLSKLRKYHLDQFIANKKQLPIGDVYGLPWDKNDCVTISVVMALFPWIKKAPDFSKPITIVDKYVLFEGDHCPDLTDKNWAANGINTTIQMAVEFLYKHQLLISGQYCLINHDKPCCCAKFNHHPHVLIVPVNLSGNRGSRSQYIKECLNETYEHNGKTYALFAATFWSVKKEHCITQIFDGGRILHYDGQNLSGKCMQLENTTKMRVIQGLDDKANYVENASYYQLKEDQLNVALTPLSLSANAADLACCRTLLSLRR